MSRNQRIVLVVAALAVAAIAFVIANPGSDDDEGSEQAAQARPAQPETETQAETPAETEPEPPPPPKPAVTRIEIQGGQVVGGAKTVDATQGESVRIVVAADAQDEIHLHGYDITKNAGPGRPALFTFKADLEGVFEMESHTAADAGIDPLVANVVVNPS